MPQRSSGFQFVLADGGNDSLAFSNQVDDAGINFVKPLSQLKEFFIC